MSRSTPETHTGAALVQALVVALTVERAVGSVRSSTEYPDASRALGGCPTYSFIGKILAKMAHKAHATRNSAVPRAARMP